MLKPILFLSYAGCSTCKKALTWLNMRGLAVTVRPITLEPPTKVELAAWLPKSSKPVRKWLNTSGQSYRALDKTFVAKATETEWLDALTKDGKLVKRPVLVSGDIVLVGFDEDAYDAAFT